MRYIKDEIVFNGDGKTSSYSSQMNCLGDF